MKRLLIYILLIGCTSIWSQSSPCNCCTDDHRAFDFWIGNWEVSKADGTVLGTNTIEKAQDGCVLIENWKSAKGGFTGGSTNFYNNQSGQWEQLWIDNSGSHLHLKGNRKDNKMILVSDEIRREDKPSYRNRITWTLNQDGSVRQLWDIVVGEEVESVAFDGIYMKK